MHGVRCAPGVWCALRAVYRVLLLKRVTRKHTSSSSSRWTYDHVFDAASTTSQVYEALAQHIVVAAMEGFNGTIFGT